MKIKYEFLVRTNKVGSDYMDVVELEFDDNLTEEEIEAQVEQDYLEWRDNYLDGGFRKVD